MSYIKGRIQTKNIDLMAVLFAAFYRSMMIYFLTPLYAAGAMTEKEVEQMELQFIRNQFGLKGDVKNVDIAKIMSFYTTSTASLVAKMGTAIRGKI
jgi:hypothetical protein